MTIVEITGGMLRAARSLAGLSQQELAERASNQCATRSPRFSLLRFYRSRRDELGIGLRRLSPSRHLYWPYPQGRKAASQRNSMFARTMGEHAELARGLAALLGSNSISCILAGGNGCNSIT